MSVFRNAIVHIPVCPEIFGVLENNILIYRNDEPMTLSHGWECYFFQVCNSHSDDVTKNYQHAWTLFCFEALWKWSFSGNWARRKFLRASSCTFFAASEGDPPLSFWLSQVPFDRIVLSHRPEESLFLPVIKCHFNTFFDKWTVLLWASSDYKSR